MEEEESDEEMAFNEEFERLINEGMSCPTCGGTPIETGVITVCGLGHHYFVVQEED